MITFLNKMCIKVKIAFANNNSRNYGYESNWLKLEFIEIVDFLSQFGAHVFLGPFNHILKGQFL